MIKNFYSLTTLLLLIVFLYYTHSVKKSITSMEENLNHTRVRYHHLLDSLTNLFDKKLDEYHNILDSLPLGSPLDTIVVASDFGTRRSPISGKWQRHAGVDLQGTYWDTVYSTGTGKVVMSSWNAGYGKCVEIKHIGGYTSKYAHLSRIWVKKGDVVNNGDPIGKCGRTGSVTGQHLHYEVSRNQELTDPLPYIFVLSK